MDGVNVKNYKFDTLYDKLGYVTQKAVLFAGSIRENVFFGESAAPESDEELKNAIELSQAEEFVDKLPDGTEHMISQMGRNVSGGQKQRLSISRALSRKPEILVFDDSFSALDYKTDAKLREGLNEKLGDTTKIIVAQRISTIRHADKIIVLDRGEAVGMGTHEELMKNCDVYKEIVRQSLHRKGDCTMRKYEKSSKGEMASAMKKIIEYMKGSVGIVAVALVLAALGAVLTIIGPDKVGEITDLIADGLMTGIDLKAVARVGIFLGAIYISSSLFTFIQQYIWQLSR